MVREMLQRYVTVQQKTNERKGQEAVLAQRMLMILQGRRTRYDLILGTILRSNKEMIYGTTSI